LRGQTDFHTIYQIVETAIHRALHELADFDQLGISCREAKNEEELEQWHRETARRRNPIASVRKAGQSQSGVPLRFR